MKRTAIVAVVIAVAVSVSVSAQRSGAVRPKTTNPAVPRTADGHPDLQGVWFFGTLTPLERPANMAGRTHLTDAEIAALEDRAGNRPQSFGLFGDQAQYVFDKRTSLVTDPPDGKVPPMTAAGEKRQTERSAARKAAENPEDLPVYERCILGFNAGPPIIPGGYNQNIQIVQTPDYLVVHTEMVHTARIVALRERPRFPTQVREWNGDPRGRWEGDTLVVTSTGFKSTGTGTLPLDGNLARTGIGWSPDENLTLTERFTRVDRDTLVYEFTINDPTVWSKPWTASIPMTRSDQQMYEYACHEGNHDFRFILAGSRNIEKSGK
jgi:hypothetical protein